ncbi:MAG: GyrI-like domain-containing protein [Acidimicrobiales bacterium]
MTSIDLKKTYREHYTATATPAVVEVPARPFLMIDGSGDPNTSQEYTDAIQTLYPMAYGLRAAVKESTGDAYTVMPLEGLWWTEDMRDFDPADKSNWLWTAMICLPDAVTQAMFDGVLLDVSAKKGLPSGDKVRFEIYREGSAAQILHKGSYADEAPAIAALHDFIVAGGHRLSGRHHEIYLSDPRRTEASKLKTIIRQPFSDR